jgi:transcriptional regulator with XRE-family HTH domain
MASLSPEQCRAARALLDWQQRDLSEKSKVSRKSILEFERGRTVPWARTIDDLREAFEAAGIEFLDEEPGGRGIGLRMRAGFKAITRKDEKGITTSPDEDKSGLDAMAWDWEAEPSTPLPEGWTEEDRADQIAYWRGRPERWAALAEVSRQCLLRAMGVDSLDAGDPAP